MAWYDEAVFYHIYPLGLTGAPKQNSYGEPEHRLNTLLPWITHIKKIGCNALYIGPLFESVGHGYETTDYKKLDSRLGTNEDLAAFVAECHRQGIKVVLDGVFNHTGRDFFAFQDLKQNREQSAYKDWYCNVNFWGNNEYNDGFSYENWGGHNLLVKLNQHNPAVRDYICDVIRFWVSEFDIDGIRLDAADVLDFEYMKALRRTANEVKPDFWLMGEVIHGDYTRWVNEGTLHCVTNYTLHKALYSGHNDHNYFEIAHTVKRLYEMGGNRIDGLRLYNFTDNHDVERIYTKLNKKEHFAPVHVLLYTLPGVPSIYYGSEFGIEGKKERFSDDSLRPALSLSDYENAEEKNPCTRLIAALGLVRRHTAALSYGDYRELLLTNRQYAFSRNYNGVSVVVTVNNDDSDYVMTLPAGNAARYRGALSGETVSVNNGQIVVNVKTNSGDIWVPVLEGQAKEPENQKAAPETADIPKIPETAQKKETVPDIQAPAKETTAETPAEKPAPAKTDAPAKKQKSDTEYWWKATETDESSEQSDKVPEADAKAPVRTPAPDADKKTAPREPSASADAKIPVRTPAPDAGTAVPAAVPDAESFEKGRIAGLQEAILAIMEKNGPVTDQMRRDVMANTHHASLVNWIKSFR
ncbi:MAG: alpha-amylase [Lachnospiraceae bacterium]|jgi:cyclomaltodextrinase|nr:alpha-amylase [Lachnospiraceae bacterium]